ncbi:hypothetical protein TNCV_4716381 [Trichonephila clavipes]|nr:hypothetical protein TNCV_4716381 [Trichonephila clavipes]
MISATRSAELSVRDCLFWETLKSKVCRKNPRSLQELPQKNSDEIAATPAVRLPKLADQGSKAPRDG